MVNFIVYLKGFGISFFLLALVSGLGYWLYILYKKLSPKILYRIKYKTLKKQHDEDEVLFIVEKLEEGKNKTQIMKERLLAGAISKKQMQEFPFLCDELIAMKGGKKI